MLVRPSTLFTSLSSLDSFSKKLNNMFIWMTRKKICLLNTKVRWLHSSVRFIEDWCEIDLDEWNILFAIHIQAGPQGRSWMQSIFKLEIQELEKSVAEWYQKKFKCNNNNWTVIYAQFRAWKVSHQMTALC